MSESLSRDKRLVLEIVVLLLLMCSGGFAYYAIGNYDYGQGYINGYHDGHSTGYHQGHVDGYQSGHDDGYQQGHLDGYQSGYNDGYSVNTQNSYNAGEAYIECWVIQNHPTVYSLWFNDAFKGVTCP